MKQFHEEEQSCFLAKSTAASICCLNTSTEGFPFRP